MEFTGRTHTFRDAVFSGRRDERACAERVLGLVLAVLLFVGGIGPAAVHATSVPSPVAGERSSAAPASAVGEREPATAALRPRARRAATKRSAAERTAQAAAKEGSAPLFAARWWMLLFGVGAGAGAVGFLYWIRVRGLKQRMEAHAKELRDEKQRAEAALEKKTEQVNKLEGINDARSRLLREFSHEFRTPLTLTLGPIDNLLEGKHGTLSEDARNQLRLARRNGTHLLWLVNQLLDLSELEMGSMALEPTEGNFIQFVAKSIWSFEGLAERRDVRLGLEASLEDPELWFDESKMERILANLLSGAFRSVEEGGSIRVKMRPAQEDDRVELVVEGTKTKFSTEGGRERLLSPVHQDDDPWGPGDVATKIGLHLVEELVDLHEGDIRLEETPGGRIQFVVSLPRQPDSVEGAADGPGGDAVPRLLGREEPGALTLSRKALSLELKNREEAASEGPSEEEVSPDSDRTTVLVIDDNSVICALVRSHLEPEYRVEEAHGGVAGYNMATTLLPDLVIADIMMPEMDGFELCKKIKQDPDVDHIPVIFLTARADLEDKVEGLDVGADAYLTKPFDPEELIAHVENLIASRRSLQESFNGEPGDRSSRDASGNGAQTEVSSEGVENAEEALPPTAEGKSLKERIEEAISDNLTDPDFGVSDLADATALSSSQLRRRMKEMYDCTPVQLIRRRRLEAGAQLLRERSDATIGEVAYAVGFNSQSYFSRSFRDEFGTSPSRYRSQHENLET